VSKDYPEALKHINCPPFVLYYYGDLEYVKNKNIGVIGMRIPSPYGISATEKLTLDLVKHNYTIVSGMALGVDSIAHQSAIENNGKTIAVLGSGIDYCYPKRNNKIYQALKENHLIISEYPGMVIPSPTSFPKRNRIIAGLSESVLVTEAMLKSGTMITVGHALEQGKEIFCVPGRITDYLGCNYLIQQGAKLTNKIEDILEG
ncbi:MAG: DNA-processing protein DprA, partial [Coprobacillaceae bacterium]